MIFKTKKKLKKKQMEFSQKIDELNQETDTLLDEITINVTIKFNGKEFLLSCEDGQEEHLEELLIHINQKFNTLKNDLGNLGENKLLLITAVKVMDEYFETKKLTKKIPKIFQINLKNSSL